MLFQRKCPSRPRSRSLVESRRRIDDDILLDLALQQGRADAASTIKSYGFLLDIALGQERMLLGKEE